jgi:signal peptidase II
LGSNLPREARFAILVVFNGLVSILTFVYALKTHNLRFIQLVGLLLVVSGGMGNLLDRLFNNGLAIDFLNLGIGSLRTGIFNVADVFVMTGAVVFMLSSLGEQQQTSAT